MAKTLAGINILSMMRSEESSIRLYRGIQSRSVSCLTSKRRAIRRSLTGFRNVDDDDAVTAGVVWSVASGAQVLPTTISRQEQVNSPEAGTAVKNWWSEID
jgi:hypothetical protein